MKTAIDSIGTTRPRSGTPSRGDIGLASLDDLRERIAVVLPDLLEAEEDAEAAFDLVLHATAGQAGTIAAA